MLLSYYSYSKATMHASLQQILSLISTLLKASSPELSARLKQRLNAELELMGVSHFDERKFGNKRFKDFLHKHMADTVSLTLPVGPGDILVTLKEPLPPCAIAPNKDAPTTSAHHIQKPIIRSDVWQAFLNQDVHRKRFFSKDDAKIVHFRDGQPPEIEAAVNDNPDSFIEIHAISTETQRAWFNSFLEKSPPNQQNAKAIQTLLESEGINGAIIDAASRMLGSNGEATWRTLRARSIHSHMIEWCDSNNIDPAIISTPPKLVSAQDTVAESKHTQTASAARTQAHTILDSLSDEDIARIVLPILVSTVLVKAHI